MTERFRTINLAAFSVFCSLPLILGLGYLWSLPWSVVLTVVFLLAFGVSFYAVRLCCPVCGNRFAQGRMQLWGLLFLWKQGAKCPRCSKSL